ncbi:MAG: protein TonB [Nonlabens sp.]|jgi:protein TonB
MRYLLFFKFKTRTVFILSYLKPQPFLGWDFFLVRFLISIRNNIKPFIMNTSNEPRGAATPLNTRRADKKAANTKVNPIINFQIGLIAALVAVFFIMELSTAVPSIPLNPSITVALTLEKGYTRPVTIIPNHKVKPEIEKLKRPKIIPVKTDLTKAPEIGKEEVLDVSDTNKESVGPVSTVPVKNGSLNKETGTSKEAPAATFKPSHIAALHEVPLFPGCSSIMDSEERVDCLNKKMARFIQRKFDVNLANSMNGNDVVKISVQFTIGIDGFPKDILVKAPNEKLEEEAYEVISRLPKMIPGKIDNKSVNVTYALPIRFQVTN